jgi:organic radical activating enzyme
MTTKLDRAVPSLDPTHLKLASLPVVETFHSIQGEGAWAGTNAFFIRLGGCEIGCPWCDTKHSWNPKRHPQCSIASLAAAAKAVNPAIVVITGGEPTLHDLTGLTVTLRSIGLRVHLETSGAYPLTGEFDWVTLSPKQFKPPQDSVFAAAHEVKVVVSNAADLVWAENQGAKISAQTVKYLQPEWNSPASLALIFDYILHHPEWRMSLQTHKYMQVR